MSCFECDTIVKLNDRRTAQAGSNARIKTNYIDLIKLRYIVTLVSAKPRPSDLGSLDLALFGAMVVFWGPKHQTLAQNAKHVIL